MLWNDICGRPLEIQAVWVSVLESQLVARRDSVNHGSTSKWLGTPLRQQPTASLQLSTPPGWEPELSGALKITQYGVVKRKSYGSIWQSPFVSLPLTISLTPEKLWLQEIMKRVRFLYLSVVVSYSLWLYNKINMEYILNHIIKNLHWLFQVIISFLHQHCVDTGCSLKDLPRVMDDRDRWRESVREIWIVSMTWWWRF